ncbi:MAG: hypothetical protein EOP39_22645 [Rubrivivax sp.]|nr:MAG: hypothetical protein EOP39_22645 [Rubrivivax sp.]
MAGACGTNHLSSVPDFLTRTPTLGAALLCRVVAISDGDTLKARCGPPGGRAPVPLADASEGCPPGAVNGEGAGAVVGVQACVDGAIEHGFRRTKMSAIGQKRTFSPRTCPVAFINVALEPRAAEKI